MPRQASKLTDKVTELMTRRGLLKQLVRLAGGVTAGAAGLLAGNSARAASSKRILCCGYITAEGINYTVCRHNKCPETMGPRKDWLLGFYEVSHCSECG